MYHPDHKKIVCGNKSNSVKIWDLEKQLNILNMLGHTACVFAVNSL